MKGGLFTVDRVSAAALAEAFHPPTLLPSRVLENALRDRLVDEALEGDRTLVRYLVGKLANGIPSERAPVVLASKSHKGRRPVHVLSFLQRVLYSVLVDAIGLDDGLGTRDSDAFEGFRQGPLAHEEYAYVAMTDVVSFYRYIDHSTLADELVSLTGATSEAERLCDFLGAVVGGPRALPQNVGPSHALADVYLDRALRSVLRRGHPVWSFSDDILLAGADWRDLNGGIEHLGAALDHLGLVLNEEKTRYFHQDTYRVWIREPDDRLANAIEVPDFFAVLHEYDPEDPPDPEGRRAQLNAMAPTVVRLLGQCVERLDADEGPSRLDAAVNRRIIAACLHALTIAMSPEAMLFARDLLAREPSLTPAVARYLRGAAFEQADGVFEHLATLLRDDTLYLSEWQLAWLLEPAVAILNEPPGLDDLEGVLAGLLEDASDVVWGRVALALAQRDAIEPAAITNRYERAPEAFRPDLVAALAWRSFDHSNPQVRAMRRDDRLNGTVIDSIIG